MGEIVTSLTVTTDVGLTVNSSTIASNSAGVAGSLLVAWLSGGVAGIAYGIRFTFTTNQGRTDSRTIPLRVIAR